jgi:hypothetical protein
MGGRVQARGLATSLDQAQATPPPAVASSVTLKVTVVISRFDNDKKTGSLPFVLMVVPGPTRGPDGYDGDATSLQMGSEVPVATVVGPAATFTYRSIGTNINASAKKIDEARYNLNLNVTDSQIMSDSPQGASVGRSSTPSFQSFKSNNRMILRDGQTVQFTAATDKASGEVVKLDVTMNVIK